MMKVIQVPPAERLNLQGNSPDAPLRLPPRPHYHCPQCDAATAVPPPAQRPARLFPAEIQALFEAATERRSAYYPAVADGRCRRCGRCFRLVAGYDEPRPGYFVYDLLALLELVEDDES